MDKMEFKKHRENFYQQLLPNSVAIFYAGKEIKSTADQVYPFEVNKNFYYLTGINQPESILLIVKGENNSETFLFIQEYDENKEKWTGKRLNISEAKEISAIENVGVIPNFSTKLKLLLSSSSEYFGTIDNLYLDLEKGLIVADKYVTTCDLMKKMKARYKNIVGHDSYEILKKLRLVKSSLEIAEIKKAIAITQSALDKVARQIKEGVFEYHIVNTFSYEVGNICHSDLAFPTIAASGSNATILHYPDAKDQLKNGELLLLDLGARYNKGYNADISRTYPISGKFTVPQREIYEIVLGCNKALIARLKPGMTLLELQEFAKGYLAGKCLSYGLISKKEDIIKCYYHNVSHYLGLDVHDVGDKQIPLVPGMVITVEPGLYFAHLKVGIRIEDNVLITSEGCEVLSKEIAKEATDIEKMMSRD